jgi:hypothetical protein
LVIENPQNHFILAFKFFKKKNWNFFANYEKGQFHPWTHFHVMNITLKLHKVQMWDILKTFKNVHIKIGQNIMLGITQSQQMEKTNQGITLGIYFDKK